MTAITYVLQNTGKLKNKLDVIVYEISIKHPVTAEKLTNMEEV